MRQKVLTLTEKADRLYSEINQFNGEGILPLSDMVYPKHDGIPDHEAAARLSQLRQSLYSLSRACQLAIDHLTFEIDQYDENENSK